MSSYGDNPGPGWSTVSDGDYPYADEAPGRADPYPLAPVSPPVVAGRARVHAPVGVPVEQEERPPTRPQRPSRRDRLRTQVLMRRKRMWLIAFAAFLILFGTTAVVATAYMDNVGVLDPNTLSSAPTKIMSDDGKVQMAQLGAENREPIPMSILPEPIKNALIAGEDKDFYHHHGVSFSGIMRAAWNNVTGGDTQGGSTITQQYVKIATKDKEMSAFRKLREAVLARKLEDKYNKEQILGFYLNNVYFGRGAIGVQVAARTFFNKDAKSLTIAEAAVLGAVVRQPEASASFPGYDPQTNAQAAQQRWNYVLDNMVDAGWLNTNDRHAQQYPAKTLRPIQKDGGSAQWGLKGVGQTGVAAGNIVNQIVDELSQAPYNIHDLKTGGYRITTTIDSKMQLAAQAAARRGSTGSLLNGTKSNVMAALVSIDPKTGRVLAYYGGDDGTGHDYAGKNMEDGKLTGGHPAGSSFKIYTLAAALKDGYSLQSHFDPAAFIDDKKFEIQNAGRDVDQSCGNYCTLEWATVHSYNVPFYKVTKLMGVDKVVAMARAAGVTTMWNTGDGKAYDLQTVHQDANSPFYYMAGYGQYPITVFDHATGAATFADRGVYNRPHFVLKVERPIAGTDKYQLIGGEKLKGVRTIDQGVVDDVNAVLQEIPPTNGHTLSGGRPVAGKTGTWQCGQTSHNCHGWFIGYTKQIATAVWVGNVGKEQPVYDKNGKDLAGAGLPGDIWEKYMNAASKGMDELRFADKANVGDPNKQQPDLKNPQDCWISWFCPQPPGRKHGRN
jgi:membrane peptidoglycan carboxypeptidase